MLGTSLVGTPPPPLLNARWAKRWLDRQPDLFQAERKPLAAERKNAHDSKVLQTRLNEFNEMMVTYGTSVRPTTPPTIVDDSAV